ncbi:MAG: hypothetical protein ACKPGH_30560, partial [Dolichospermum sp.]
RLTALGSLTKPKPTAPTVGQGNLSNSPVGFFETFGTGKTKFETTFFGGIYAQKKYGWNDCNPIQPGGNM